MRTLTASLLFAAALPAALPAQGADLDACLARLRPQARASGIHGPVYDRYTAGLSSDPSVLESLDYQPEFRTPIWDYLAGLVDAERVEDGKARLAEHAATLARVEQQYGVDAATVVAVWGVESNFGRTFGKKPLLQSLATLSCAGRRQEFFRGELFATIRLLQSGDLRAEGLVGSWAGAFGHTQFMPSTYARIAVDGDGDGRRDLVGSIPDALASTANYLKRSGWQSGRPWGHEVILPKGYAPAVSGRQARRPLSAWLADGLVRADGGALESSDAPTALLLPAGKSGPAFLVFRNYDAIFSYNAAESYALAISLLSDRLRGHEGLKAAWPTDDPGLTRAQRRELQQLLLDRGHDIGEVDGMIGAKSREAIAKEQARLGRMADGRAGLAILTALKHGAAADGRP
ncbi:lytic murein transglycosylase [Arenimonas terrae]|uniref:Lytic murein transglycosylase n=1 Tax=Arenimonas terrae TaxID=2546226 RepID=A0A5C4RV93_9GAMM|nr:lytic murein transglycosylase [Arenimonas terrae]